MHYHYANKLIESNLDLKLSAKHYWSAATLFENIAKETKLLQLPEIGVNFSEPSLSLFINSAKAQAHRCIYELFKAKHLQTNPWGVAKIAFRVGDLYYIAHKTNPLPLPKEFAKKQTYDSKRACWGCLAKLFHGIAYFQGALLYSREDGAYNTGSMGIALGFIRQAEITYKEAEAFIPQIDPMTKTFVQQYTSQLTPKKQQIEKLNKEIYKEEVPNLLPEIEPMDYPNKTTFLETNWEHPFTGDKLLPQLVPLEICKLESEYKDIVQKLLKIAEAEENNYEVEENKFKEEHKIQFCETIIQKDDAAIPKRIEDSLKKFHKKQGMKKIKKMEKMCNGEAGNCEIFIMYTGEQITEEAKQDERYKKRYGERWIREQSSVLSKGMSEEAEVFKQKLMQSKLQSKELFAIFSNPQVKAEIDLISQDINMLRRAIPRAILPMDPQDTLEHEKY